MTITNTLTLDNVEVKTTITKTDSGEIQVTREIKNLDVTNYIPSETLDYVGGRPIHR